MFYIGNWDKQKVVTHYLTHNDVRKVLIIYNQRLFTQYEIPSNIPHEYIEYKQTIMYKNYYRLLQWIDKKTLIISDELLITENRYQLEYNCINAFLNQTPQRLVFSYLPFINQEKDFMILLDQYNSALYKGEQFDYEFVKQVKTFFKPVHLTAKFFDIAISESDKQKYEVEKEKRFTEIGLKDPDTIPRNLAIMAGDMRAKACDPIDTYLCRNLRFKKLQCTTYKEDELNTIMDFPIKRQELIAVLTRTKKTEIQALTSELSIDVWHKKDLLDWIEKLENFYVKATLSKRECSGSGTETDLFSL